MFNEVGNEIKGYSESIVRILSIPAVLIGILIWVILGKADQGTWGFIIGAVYAFFGIGFARFVGAMVNGFGELIEKTCSINEKLGHGTQGN